MGWPPRYIRVADVGSSSLALAFQSVSLGLAAAIGAGIARPGRTVVLGAGDGGFLMSIADLETAVRLGTSLCIVVYNDSSYAAEVHHFGKIGFPTDIVEFPDVDLAAIARGFGARAATVRTAADFAPVREWIAQGAPGVFLIDAKIVRTLEADWHRDAYKD
jgi:thiamine pyrophosphate-dependent acetolactate synthase large subunit-like protein